jgi:hypothetical protein
MHFHPPTQRNPLMLVSPSNPVAPPHHPSDGNRPPRGGGGASKDASSLCSTRRHASHHAPVGTMLLDADWGTLMTREMILYVSIMAIPMIVSTSSAIMSDSHDLTPS